SVDWTKKRVKAQGNYQQLVRSRPHAHAPAMTMRNRHSIRSLTSVRIPLFADLRSNRLCAGSGAEEAGVPGRRLPTGRLSLARLGYNRTWDGRKTRTIGEGKVVVKPMTPDCHGRVFLRGLAAGGKQPRGTPAGRPATGRAEERTQ